MEEIFEWKRLLFNDLPYNFLLEVLFRSTIMFLLLLATIRFTGKRGVKQLSLFETVIIIALGSAAGDPMFYEDVGIIPPIVVFITILLLYRLITSLIAKSKKVRVLLEGKTVSLIKDGVFTLDNIKKENLAQDEFFLELRIKSIEHIGQVRLAYLETDGNISAYFYSDTEVKYGLPILPELFESKSDIIPNKGIYSCSFCGFTEEKEKGKSSCKICNKTEWVKSINSIRIS